MTSIAIPIRAIIKTNCAEMNLFNTVGLTEMILPTTAWCGLLPLLAALFSGVSAGKADKCETCRKIATSFKEVSTDSMFSH